MGIMSRQFKPGQLKPGLLYDITASRALTASYALNSAESYRIVSGSITASVNTRENIFLIQSSSRQLFAVSESGVVVVATQSIELNDPAPYGGIYFTSGSFFIGLE
jgi:hypothetical protein